MPLDPHEVQAETVRYLVAKNQELAAEVARLAAALAAAQAAPVVEWREDVGFSHARIGRFWMVVRRDGWRLEFSQPFSSTPDLVEGGPETGPAGKAACEAAYRRAAGWVPSHSRLVWSGATPSFTLSLVVGRLTVPVLMLSTSPDMWWLSAGGTIHRARTPADVLAATVAYVESLGLPCLLPPFPGASNAF